MYQIEDLSRAADADWRFTGRCFSTMARELGNISSAVDAA